VNKKKFLTRKEAVTFFIHAHKLLTSKKVLKVTDTLAWAVQCFSFFDANGDGVIDVNEWGKAVELIQKSKAPPLIKEIEVTIGASMIFSGRLQQAVAGYIQDLETAAGNEYWKEPQFIENAADKYRMWLLLRQKKKKTFISNS